MSREKKGSNFLSFEPVLLKYIHEPKSETLEFYLSHGGYESAKKALSMDPKELIEMVKESRLRGRGGAGFPTGMKWSFIPEGVKPVYLACNADESEPGTFKDRAIIEKDPHQLLEGVIITSWAIQSHQAYIYIRGEFTKGAKILEDAIQSARDKGFIGEKIFGTNFDLNVFLMRGAGAYICGEETGMLSSIEGNRGYPKLKPPFPAVEGLFSKPTVINNVETLANLPHILREGVDWHRSFGTEKSPGFKIFSLSGHVQKPDNYELPLGTPLSEIIFQHAGGVLNKKKIKAVIPGGSSTPILKGDQLDIPMDYESLQSVGSMLGSGAITVLDEDSSIVSAIWNLMRFYHHESCGQCTPCREGTGWLEKIMARMAQGLGQKKDLDTLHDICNNMQGKTICALADAAAMPMRSYLQAFPEEFEACIAD